MEGILVNVRNTDGGKSTAALVLQALKAKRVFVFSELLALPQVQKLEHGEEAGTFKALQIFSYGTYSDYAATPGLPSLNPAMEAKLRQLTVVSLASRSKSLQYSQVITETGVESIRNAEDLVISCVYDGLLRARLDQKNQTFLIQWCAARDVRPEAIDEMIAKLAAWNDSAGGILGKIDQALLSADDQRKAEDAQHTV